jgi:hypothetical protein
MTFPKYLYQVTDNDRPVSAIYITREGARSYKRNLETIAPEKTFKIYRVAVDTTSAARVR